MGRFMGRDYVTLKKENVGGSRPMGGKLSNNYEPEVLDHKSH